MVWNKTFRGKQKEFLKKELIDYGKAREEGSEKEYVAHMTCLFFLVFDITKGIHHEPTDEEIAAVDPDANVAEFVAPVQKPGQTMKAFNKELREHTELMQTYKHSKEVS